MIWCVLYFWKGTHIFERILFWGTRLLELWKIDIWYQTCKASLLFRRSTIQWF